MAAIPVLNITFIVITQYQQQCYLPAYEVAVAEANELYKDHLHAEMIALTRPDLFNCAAVSGNAVELSTSLYYQDTLARRSHIFISPNCVGAMLEMAPLMTEWNVPIVTISGNSRKLSDKEKYPTVISMSPSDNFMMAIFVKTTLERFRWTNVFLLCDKGDRVVPFYIAMCSIFKDLLRPADGHFNLYDVSLNNVGTHHAEADLTLDLISSRSRVVIVLANAVVMRQLMIHARRKNMTNGDYVFFFMQPFLLLDLFSDLSWRLDKEDDILALEAFRTVFYLITDTESIAKNLPAKTQDEMVDRMRSYLLCKDRAKAPVEMFAAYEAVTLLAKVAHDIVQNSREKKVRPTLIGTAFVREFSNRTHNLSTVSASFDTSACKIPNFLIKLFNSTTQTFEVTTLPRKLHCIVDIH